MPQNTRRKMIAGAVAGLAAGAAGSARAQTGTPSKKVVRIGPAPAATPMYSPGIQFGNLLFLSGAIHREPGDIKAATEAVLGDIKKQLEAAGSSMSKVLKATVFLADLKDFAGMNEIYLGKFGDQPPARTAVAVAGISANSLIEVDIIAYV